MELKNNDTIENSEWELRRARSVIKHVQEKAGRLNNLYLTPDSKPSDMMSLVLQIKDSLGIYLDGTRWMERDTKKQQV